MANSGNLETLRIGQVFWVAVSGASIGWMLGLSNSPVLSTFLTPILGIIVASIAALAALQSEANWLPRVGSFLPIGVFLFFSSAFATLGVWARSNQVLVPEKSRSEGIDGSGGMFNSLSGGRCSELLATEISFAEQTIASQELASTALGRALLAASEIDQATFDSIVRAACGI